MRDLVATWIVRDAVCVVRRPIKPGVTGHIAPCGAWHWFMSCRPPGWRRNIAVFGGSNLAFVGGGSGGCAMCFEPEYSRVGLPADTPRRISGGR